jgi:hypothetical protein
MRRFTASFNICISLKIIKVHNDNGMSTIRKRVVLSGKYFVYVEKWAVNRERGLLRNASCLEWELILPFVVTSCVLSSLTSQYRKSFHIAP